MPEKKMMTLAALALILSAVVPACAQQGIETADEEETTTEAITVTDEEPAKETVTITGVIEKPQITTYMYGTHAVTEERTGTRYALKSEEKGLLDGYIGRRVTVYGDPAPGYEEGGIEGGPPLLNVTRVEPVDAADSTGPPDPTDHSAGIQR